MCFAFQHCWNIPQFQKVCICTALDWARYQFILTCRIPHVYFQRYHNSYERKILQTKLFCFYRSKKHRYFSDFGLQHGCRHSCRRHQQLTIKLAGAPQRPRTRAASGRAQRPRSTERRQGEPAVRCGARGLPLSTLLTRPCLPGRCCGHSSDWRMLFKGRSL